MLINFSFGNFRSFRDIKSLRMEAGRVDDLTESVIEKEGPTQVERRMLSKLWECLRIL